MKNTKVITIDETSKNYGKASAVYGVAKVILERHLGVPCHKIKVVTIRHRGRIKAVVLGELNKTAIRRAQQESRRYSKISILTRIPANSTIIVEE